MSRGSALSLGEDVKGVQDALALSAPAAAAGDSMTVAAWTMVSRVTGVARFAAIGAVLGPTFFGNTYQFTNSLPNLIYYGFLAGSLLSSLLVPALVRHVDSGDRRASERVAGGFLGATLLALVAIAPLAITLGPLGLRFASLGGGAGGGAAQEGVGRWLIVMFIPQVFFYGVIGTATAVMNARRRFALAAAAPALENVGIIAVLGVTAVLFHGPGQLEDVPSGELLLLGLGTTGAVALHAFAQWWGARRAGALLVPRFGWRDPEVRAIVRRALPALAQAGLVALQVLTLLIIANRLPGGVVAFQMGLSFYYLALAIGATPVALSLLPRLARLHAQGDVRLFRDTLVRGFALGFFVAVPAAAAYLALAAPLARAVSFGRMSSTTGVALVAVSLAALAVAVVAQSVFLIATYASYARGDTRAPLVSMLLQAVTCMGLASLALLLQGSAVLAALGLAFSASIAIAACHLATRVLHGLCTGAERLRPSLVKVVVGALLMTGPARLAATVVEGRLGGSLGSLVAAAAAVLVGAAVFVTVQALWRTPELGWLAGGLSHIRDKAKSTMAEAPHG